MMPTCGRCAKRSKQEQCVYHPAPLTKSTNQQDADSPANSPRINSFSTAYHSTVDGAGVQDTVVPEPKRVRYNEAFERSIPTENLPALPASPESVEDLRKPLPAASLQMNTLGFDQDTNFMSHSAVLSEYELKVGIQSFDGLATSASTVTPVQIHRGAAVLTLLKDLSTIEKYIDKWYSFAGGIVIIEPMVKIWLDGVGSTWRRFLDSQKPDDLRLMSQKICENTLTPVSQTLKRHTTPREFCASATGPFLRWEVVGIIVTLVSLVAQSLKDGDPIFCSHDDAPVDRAALALKMHNASEMCVQFCDEFGVLNDLYLWLLYENTIAYCSMRTRGSYENSRKHANLANALLSSNLHQEIKVDDRTPFFMSELRKRLFTCAYDNDKYAASFGGRPPRLTRQYCTLQIPLDLSDAQIMSQGKDLEDALYDLDGQGWNQHGAVQRSTFARLSSMNALITEEILEISLGNSRQEDIVRRAAEIESRTDKHWDELPDFLRIDMKDPWNHRRSPLELLFLAFIRLNHLDHHFMLQRTLSKKVSMESQSPNTKLVAVCKEIFDFVVLMVDNKDHFRDFQIDFVQILLKHGIPAAAVLAVELLHQEENPASISAIAHPLHRSETIQKLSVFVSCLGTVRPDASGYQSCDRGRTFLKKVLDIILGPGPASVSSFQGATADDPMFGAPLLQPASDGDFVRWLEGMDWNQDGYINFN
ncbi:hypothetical protein FB567DRAFT_542217 [Paraphoma chrysanthemicola]|uniref:Transcription factor domain-containing protein n=1 Tax=Paraphoma chrysanthemicola TaxID=798071 RepID=A0A8K0QRQ4_9PLEO|nr:hypothetical protein FB567DRAFT_542217 [Paraphoma chrysanthemicola]